MALKITRIILALLAIAMTAATLPAYWDPASNPGLTNLTGDALALGDTAGAFLGRQLALILLALGGAISGKRLLIAAGGFGMAFMNGHDAIFMGLGDGDSTTVIGGLVFAILGALVVFIAATKLED